MFPVNFVGYSLCTGTILSLPCSIKMSHAWEMVPQVVVDPWTHSGSFTDWKTLSTSNRMWFNELLLTRRQNWVTFYFLTCLFMICCGCLFMICCYLGGQWQTHEDKTEAILHYITTFKGVKCLASRVCWMAMHGLYDILRQYYYILNMIGCDNVTNMIYNIY